MIKNIVSKFLFKHLFKLVTEDEILRFDATSSSMYFMGNKLTTSQVQSLGEDARIIQKTQLWGLLMKEMQFLANKKMYNDSLSMSDILGGKFMLYTIDILSKKVYNISKQK